jgi:predicted helicase
MVLTDTFQMTEENDLVDKVVLPENNAKAERQLHQSIRVIVGNPPYSAGQDSANDNNQNLIYPTLDTRIKDTYAAQSSATLVRNLYDSYIRAIRWASDRIGGRGIVAFVTNGSFIEANNMDGLRKCLTKDFTHLYVFNLRGNARTQGEERRKEAGGIFGEGSRTPVVVSVMVKDPTHVGPCELRYHDIGDYLSREEKLAIIEEFGSTANIEWQQLVPNSAGDWINQRDPAFEKFIPLGDKEGADAHAIFGIYSLVYLQTAMHGFTAFRVPPFNRTCEP